MKRHIRKTFALLLSMVLVLSMLPSASASGEDLRKTVVQQTRDIMDVDYTLKVRIKRTDATGTVFDEYTAGGVRPATYFDFPRMRIVQEGVPVSNTPGTLEYFKTQLGTKDAPVKGVGHMLEANKTGFNIHSFLTDVISRVSPSAPTSFREALTHNALVALLPGANLNAADSKAAIGDTAAAKAAYGKLRAGDLLLAWDNDAHVGAASDPDEDVQAPIHAMVVKDVSGEQVTVMYPAFSQPLWGFQCETCGLLDYEGPTSGACPKHVSANQYYTFQGYFMHKETYPDSDCKGRWKPISGTTWRTETVSYDALLGENGANIPYGCHAAYLPYSLAVYSSGAPAAEVKVTTAVDAGTIAGGFTAKVTSNYRIVAFDAVLTSEGGIEQHFESVVPDWKAWSWDYSDPALDLALMECKTGKYNLTLKVKTGVSGDPKVKDGYVTAYSFDFGLASAAVCINTDKTVVVQGDDVTASLKANQAGYTAVKTTVSYDYRYFTFNKAKSVGKGVTFSDNGYGKVSVRYAGDPLKADDVFAKVVFTGNQTGGFAVTKDVTPIKLLELSTSKTPGAADEQLVGDRADGVGMVTLGFNAVVYKDYVKGMDLIMAFVRDQSIVVKSQAAMTYDGKLMHEITQGNYHINGDRYYCTFAYLTPNADPAKLALDPDEKAAVCPEIVYGDDVNLSGVIDIADVQAIANIYNGKLDLEGNETKWFRADIDRNGRVDAKDRNALLRSLYK